MEFFKTKLFKEMFSFLIIGLFSSLTYVLFSSVSLLVLEFPRWICASIGFTFGTLVSYFGNSYLTFQKELTKTQFTKFLIVTGFGYFLGIIIWEIANYFEGPWWLGMTLTVLIVPWINFLGHKIWTYK